MTVSKKLTVPDISCGHCVMRVEKASRLVPGVIEVHASAEDKTVTLTLENDTALAAVRDALENIGYPAA